MPDSPVADRLEQLYARVKMHPETAADREKFTLRPDAFLAFLDLRQIIPEVLRALHSDAGPTDYLIKRLRALGAEEAEAILADAQLSDPLEPEDVVALWNWMLDRVVGEEA